jgi:hypothetical protein
MKTHTSLIALFLAIGSLGAAPVLAQDTTGDALDVVESSDNADAAISKIELPEQASEEARENAAFGLETANEARERGLEQAQQGRDKAAEARANAASQASEAASQADSAQDAGRDAADSAAGARDAARGGN